MEKTSEGKEDEEEEGGGDRDLAIWDCGSPLYDSHELVSLSHIIDRHLMAVPHVGGSKRLIPRFHRANNVVTPMVSNPSSRENSKGSAMVDSVKEFDARKKRKKRKVTIGGWKETKTWLSAVRKRINGLWRK